MRKPPHLVLGQVGQETTKTCINKLSSGTLGLVEWIKNTDEVYYDRATWAHSTVKSTLQKDLRILLTNMLSFVLRDTPQALRNDMDSWDGCDHFIHSLHLLTFSDDEFTSQPVLSASDAESAARKEEVEKAEQRLKKKIAVTLTLESSSSIS